MHMGLALMSTKAATFNDIAHDMTPDTETEGSQPWQQRVSGEARSGRVTYTSMVCTLILPRDGLVDVSAGSADSH